MKILGSSFYLNLLRVNENKLNYYSKMLSSGKRINSAADDAAGIAIATRMTSHIRSTDMAMRNAQDGRSMLETADGAMGSMNDILLRMRDLSVQADNGTLSTEQKQALQDEFDMLRQEVDSIAEKTQFNGVNLLDTDNRTVKLHVGSEHDDTLSITFDSARTSKLGVDTDSDGTVDTSLDAIALIDVDSDSDGTVDITGNAQTAIQAIDGALDQISSKRSDLGAYMNRLDFKIDNLAQSKINAEEARSRIMDADIAQTSSLLTKHKIIQEAGIAMLTERNQSNYSILKLLGNN